MSADLRVTMPNRPGILTKTFESLAAAGVEVQGICGDLRPGERWGYVHLLVDDAAPARKVLSDAGIEVVAEHEVDLVPMSGGAEGVLAATSPYAAEDRNLEVLYVAIDGRLVVGTEDMRKDRLGVKMKDARY
ncbi:MAG: hypothetical protein M3273_00450 [Actinomycetota bacterium]|nr:hypothetical protein [Actinomycetota bacterium]